MYTILCIVTSFHFTSGGILQGARISWCVTLALCDSKASAMQMFLMSSIEEKERLLQPAPVLQPTSWNCGRRRLPGLLCWQRVSCLWSYADEKIQDNQDSSSDPCELCLESIRTENAEGGHFLDLHKGIALQLWATCGYWSRKEVLKHLKPSWNDFLCRYSDACPENYVLALRL